MVKSEVIELLSSDEEGGSTTIISTSMPSSSPLIQQRSEEINAQQLTPSGSRSAKRAREDETTTRDGETVNSLLRQLLKVDADQLAMVERHDSVLISQLELFSDNLRASIVRVKNARLDEEKALQQAREKAFKVQYEKQRSEMVASKVCFECMKPSGTVEACTGFKKEGISGEGVLACEGCRDNKAICPECSHFLCEPCCDPSYKCKECEEIICIDCAENDDYAGKHCECSEFCCAECADGSFLEEQCCACATKYTSCNNCSDDSGLKKCEGDCNEPLCDGCEQKLACGNEVHLCGDCEYDCVDCDMCAGYYHCSRWN